MPKIKFVYFDVGGVLLIDFVGNNKWLEMKRDLGITPEKDEKFNQIWERYRPFISLNCDVDEIIDELAQEVGITLPDHYSMLTDFVSRFDKNSSMLELALKVKAKYHVGLLTNMAPRMLAVINQRGLLPNISWDAVVDSSVVGFKKPDANIFEIAEKMARVEPNEILFIDNLSENVTAAQDRGWKAILYDLENPIDSSLKIQELLGV